MIVSKNILGEFFYYYCFVCNLNRVIMSYNYFINCCYFLIGNNDY